jgi:secreted Zn-dependent insulinase-like peptidase
VELTNEMRYHAKPINFLSSVFGHEGPNTLTASLKRDNLISDLTTSKNH